MLWTRTMKSVLNRAYCFRPQSRKAKKKKQTSSKQSLSSNSLLREKHFDFSDAVLVQHVNEQSNLLLDRFTFSRFIWGDQVLYIWEIFHDEILRRAIQQNSSEFQFLNQTQQHKVLPVSTVQSLQGLWLSREQLYAGFS